MKCDFCFTETVTTESGGYHFCAYCRAVAPVIKRMSSSNVSFLAVEQIRALCALANVMETKCHVSLPVPELTDEQAEEMLDVSGMPSPKRGRGRPPKTK